MARRTTRHIKKQDSALNAEAFKALARKVFHRHRIADGEVPAEQFERILDTARWTPSVANLQPWLLAGANGESGRGIMDTLARNPGNYEDYFAASADGDLTRDMHNCGAMMVVMGQRQAPFWRESCLLATYQIMLAAHAEGLAARTLMPRSPNDLAQILRVPADYLTYALVLIGQQGLDEADTSLLKPVNEVSIILTPQERPED